MKVLLISENRCRDNLVPWPIGAADIAAAAEAAGHEVRGLDLMFSEDPLRVVTCAIGSFEPDCIGVSLRNIDNQDMHDNVFFLPFARELVTAIRSETGCPLVLGGAGFSIFPLECLAYTGAQMGIAGEAESSFTALLDALASGGDYSGVPGLAVLRDGSGSLNPPSPDRGFRLAPPPDRVSFDVSRYNWTPGGGPPFVANIQARRGCHMRCIYCSSPLIEGREVRCRDAADVASELEALDRVHGIKTVVFTDSNFNYPPEYAEELCARIAGKQLSVRWLCTINPMIFDEPLFELMKKAGCMGVSLGNESGSDRMLESLKKDFTAGDVRRNFEAIREQGMRVVCFLMFGGPGETRETVEESIALMDGLGPDEVRVTVGIRIFPGCELEGIAAAEGVIREGQELLTPAFYCSEEVRPWLYDHVSKACASRQGWHM